MGKRGIEDKCCKNRSESIKEVITLTKSLNKIQKQGKLWETIKSMGTVIYKTVSL